MTFFVVVIAAVCTQTLIENINLNCLSHHQIPFFVGQGLWLIYWNISQTCNARCGQKHDQLRLSSSFELWSFFLLLYRVKGVGSSSRVVHRWTGERATLRRWNHFGSAFLHMNLHAISTLFGSQYQKVEELFSSQEGEKCTSCEEPVDAGWGGSPAK